ncbi:MAG: Fic family protein [Mangrovibacterium sp.]
MRKHKVFMSCIWRYLSTTDQAENPELNSADELTRRLIVMIDHEMNRDELMTKLDLKHKPNFSINYLDLTLKAGYIEMTLPDKPNSPNQKYRLTNKGLNLKQLITQ